MKKTTAFMMILFIITSLPGITQEIKTGNVKKKQQYCSAKITKLDKSVEKYALGGFADDSIIVFPIQMVGKHPEILVEKQTRIAATNIKKIAISIEKIKHSPDIYSNDSAYKKDANDAIASAFKKNKTNEAATSTGEILSDAGSIILLPLFLPLIPVVILLSQEKVYHINGKPEKLHRMEKELADKKHLTKK